MPEYRIGFTRSTNGWIYFTAENAVAAQDLVVAYERGEIDQEDLPNQNEREWDYEYHLDTLQEVDSE